MGKPGPGGRQAEMRRTPAAGPGGTPGTVVAVRVREGGEARRDAMQLELNLAECEDLMQFARGFDKTKKKPRPVVGVEVKDG